MFAQVGVGRLASRRKPPPSRARLSSEGAGRPRLPLQVVLGRGQLGDWGLVGERHPGLDLTGSGDG